MGNTDLVGGLVGMNDHAIITASYATGNANGGDGDSDQVGGLVGLQNAEGHTIGSYATGNANGGSGNLDSVGGLVGHNGGMITASYSTGAANGGAGDDSVGRLVGQNDNTITASYGFGGTSNGSGGSAGTTPRPANAKVLTQENSATNDTDRWSTTVWDFGTTNQRPALKWVTSGPPSYACIATLLLTMPTRQMCGGIIPGQVR